MAAARQREFLCEVEASAVSAPIEANDITDPEDCRPALGLARAGVLFFYACGFPVTAATIAHITDGMKRCFREMMSDE
jgi:hypothetical protein